MTKPIEERAAASYKKMQQHALTSLGAPVADHVFAPTDDSPQSKVDATLARMQATTHIRFAPRN